MSRKLVLLGVFLSFMLCSVLVPSALATSMWSYAYGGTGNDGAFTVVEAPDGGFVLAGITQSFAPVYSDMWLVKTDANGTMQWNKTYGGQYEEECRSMVVTSDGGFALAGSTGSYGAGQNDFYLVKTDALGTMQWNKTYGGAGFDMAYSLITTSDAGYALAGYTESFGPSRMSWLVKTDASGNMQWNKTYGSPYFVQSLARVLVAAADGGYAMVGDIATVDTHVMEGCLVKTDASGNLQWNQTYEGSMPMSLVATSDGGYAMAGGLMLIKTDSIGNMLWNRAYEGVSVSALIATSDGGYALVGGPFLVKTGSLGNMIWNKTYVDGGINFLTATSDDGYALGGSTLAFGAGDSDFWLVKTDAMGVYPEYASLLIPVLVLSVATFIIINRKKVPDFA